MKTSSSSSALEHARKVVEEEDGSDIEDDDGFTAKDPTANKELSARSRTDEDGDYDDEEEEKESGSEKEQHSEEEKDSELDDDESVLIGLTPGGPAEAQSEYSDITDTSDSEDGRKRSDRQKKRKRGEMPGLVTTTDDDHSDNGGGGRRKKWKSKNRKWVGNQALELELKAKYECFRSVQIVIDEPRIQCSLQIALPLNHEPILLESLIDTVCTEYSFVRKIGGIEAVHIQYDKNGNDRGSNWKIIISGFNKAVLELVDKWVDLSTFETNHIWQIYQMYGIEAARNAIIKELCAILGAYGLDVSYRHMSLVADSMTFFGELRPMTRKSMQKSTSPFLRITYEMAQRRMIESCLNKDIDNLTSASSAIVMGQVGKFGTGTFEIKQDLEALMKMQRNRQKEEEVAVKGDSYYSDESDDSDDDES